MSNQQNKVIVLFVEGYTDYDFYKKLTSHLRAKNAHNFKCRIETINLKGIGNYKKDALRQLNNLKTKYPNSKFYVFLCYDTDVFELSRKPPVNMSEVKKSLLEQGATKVEFIKAKTSIEDWFLYDYEGVINFLNLKHKPSKGHGTGQDFLKKIFKMADKIYVKGAKVEGFIDYLDIEKIESHICPSLKSLCKCIGLNCKNVCEKKSL